MELPGERRLPLLPSRTFVLQLATDVQVESGHIAGRVEHLVSRHAVMFQSYAELLAFMAQRLREEEQEPGPEAREPHPSDA